MKRKIEASDAARCVSLQRPQNCRITLQNGKEKKKKKSLSSAPYRYPGNVTTSVVRSIGLRRPSRFQGFWRVSGQFTDVIILECCYENKNRTFPPGNYCCPLRFF